MEGREHLHTILNEIAPAKNPDNITKFWGHLDMDKFPQLRVYLRGTEKRYWFCLGRYGYSTSETRYSSAGKSNVLSIVDADVFICMDQNGRAETTGDFGSGHSYQLNVERIAFSCIDNLLEGAADDAEAPRIDLPSMVRNEEPVAVNRLDELGFKWKLEYEENDQVPRGQVIRQNPRAGARLPESALVTLTVSLGVEVLAVPDAAEWDMGGLEARVVPYLLDLTEAEARVELREGGFIVAVIHQQVLLSENAGRVIAQDPPPATAMKSDRLPAVTITVGSG